MAAGIGRSFRYLTEALQEEIFNWGYEHSQTSEGIAEGLGRNFPSLSQSLQAEIIKRVGTDATNFTKGLGIGLKHCIKYVDQEMQREILNLAEKNAIIAEMLRTEQ